MIKSKQLESTLGSESSPFTAIYSDDFIGDLNGAVRFSAKNTSGNIIEKGQAVYVTGVSGDTKPTISLAQANSSSTMPAFGLAMEDISNNQDGEIITFGNLTGVNTDAYSITDTLYISSSTAGGLTSTPPSGSTSLIQNIGKVIRSHLDSGTIKVGGAGRSAATPNLDEGKFFIGTAANQSSQSAYSLPLVDGSQDQILSTNGSGQLSFVDQVAGGGSAADEITIGDSATTIATTSGNITIDAQGNDTDIIFKGTDNNIDIEMLRLDASSAGSASFSNDIKLISDNSAIYFGADQETLLSHYHNSGLRLWVNPSVAGDNDPTLWLQKTSSTSNIGPRLWLYHDKTAAVDGDVLGTIDFTGDDSADGGSLYNYCSIQGIAKNVTADAWQGEIQLKVRKGGASNADLNSALTLQANSNNGSTVDVIDHDGGVEGLKLGGTLVTSTAAELNFLDTSLKTPSSGDVLAYDGTSLAWSTPAAGGSTPSLTVLSGNATENLTAPSGNEEIYILAQGNVDVFMVSASSAGEGFKYHFKYTADGGYNFYPATINVNSSSSDTIDDSSSTYVDIANIYDALTLVSDGTSKWYII